MKYISSEAGQSLQLYNPDEVRPLERGPFLPDLMSQITSRYKFAKPPVGLPADAQSPVKFEMGKMLLEGYEEIYINSIEIYRDGIIVNSRNTDDCDAVIDDIFPWLCDSFGFREPETRMPRRYVSVVVVDFDVALDSFLVKFQNLQQIVSEAISANRGEKRELRVAQIMLATNIADANREYVRLEVRQGATVENRYFCNAPLPTRAHLEMLAALEKTISGKW